MRSQGARPTACDEGGEGPNPGGAKPTFVDLRALLVPLAGLLPDPPPVERSSPGTPHPGTLARQHSTETAFRLSQLRASGDLASLALSPRQRLAVCWTEREVRVGVDGGEGGQRDAELATPTLF